MKSKWVSTACVITVSYTHLKNEKAGKKQKLLKRQPDGRIVISYANDPFSDYGLHPGVFLLP